MADQLKVVNKKSFSKHIEELVTVKPMPYMDAILMCANNLGLEPEVAGKLVSKNIKQKLESEVAELNLLVPCAKLPL